MLFGVFFMNNSRSELYPWSWCCHLVHEKTQRMPKKKRVTMKLGFQNNPLAKRKHLFLGLFPDYYKPTSQFSASRSVKNPNVMYVIQCNGSKTKLKWLLLLCAAIVIQSVTSMLWLRYLKCGGSKSDLQTPITSASLIIIKLPIRILW